MSVRVQITSGPLEYQQAAPSDETGASLEFVGIVRASEDGSAISGLEYEIYQPMAKRVLHDLAMQAIERFGLIGLDVEHAMGVVPVGGASLRVVIHAGHRGEAITAMAWFIDRLKEDVPIWKKPIFASNPPQPPRQAANPRPSPSSVLKAVCDRTTPVGTERVALCEAVGRILAEPLVADRDLPAVALSAMDGFAVAHADLGVPLPVCRMAKIGEPPLVHQADSACRIVTGAAIPTGADTVIPIEWATDDPKRLVLHEDRVGNVAPGQFVRPAAASISAGMHVIGPGRPIHPAMIAAMASFGLDRPLVHRRVRVAVVVTGDELMPVDSDPPPWQIRDANGPALEALFRHMPWASCCSIRSVPDDREQIEHALADTVERADAVVLSGGVSVGPADHVPEAIKSTGADILAHGVLQKPGGPVLAAVMPSGVPIFGLPGNPVSALVTAHTLVLPVLESVAGISKRREHHRVPVSFPDDRAIGLWWHRLVDEQGGTYRYAPESGSGDVVAAARSDGFV
ncbi:MAG TPA: hypothetical protein ENJ00_01145, partial [Phycisphaerales bacterium]|nr:hypothetical protein [Phycisphaerales bacterium]